MQLERHRLKGNGIFVSELLKQIPQKVSYRVVSEAGASVYSALRWRQRFPTFDGSLRSAVSIARRRRTPCRAVKIDPQA
jgi:uncharacterized protein